jgi:phage shock protein A
MISPLSELEGLLKEKKNLENLISHYRDEYKRVRVMVKDYKHKLKETNLKILQMSKLG